MNKARRILPPLFFGIVLLGFWQFGVLHGIFHITRMQLPFPSQILQAFISHISVIGQDALITVGPAVAGLMIGAVTGYCTALIITAYPVGMHGLMILSAAINAIPVIALAPLMNRWFTVPFVTKIAVIMVASSGSMTIHAARGLNDTDTARLDLMRSCAADKRSTYLKFRIPNSLPSVFSGLKIGVSSAMVATIISEFFSKETAGLGYMIKHSLKVGNQKPLGWAYIFAVSILSIFLYCIVCALEHHLIRWHISQR